MIEDGYSAPSDPDYPDEKDRLPPSPSNITRSSVTE